MATQFGMFLHSIEDAAGNARRLEALGYDYVGCGEHVSFCDHTSNSVTSLAAAARATSHIRLASAIVLLPRYPAALAGRAGRVGVFSDWRRATGRDPHPPPSASTSPGAGEVKLPESPAARGSSPLPGRERR